MYLSLEGVSKKYGEVRAVDLVNISIEKNEFISLLGPSGSGKTTLLRIIAGLERPTTGRITIDGADVTDLPPQKRGIAMVFQEFLLFPHRTVRENLIFPLRMMKLSREVIEERLDWCTNILSLKGLEGRYPNQLSGGQQQRVALGRGLVAHPKVLLLDEPLASLDRELRQEMEVEIRRYQMQLGIPFIYVTHNQEEALSMSDRIAVVRAGRIDDFAERAKIYDTPKTAFIAQFVGRSNRYEGTVTAIAGDETILECAGMKIAALTKADILVGQQVSLFVKNEKIRLSAEKTEAGGNLIPCTLKDVIFHGAFADYILQAADGRELVSSRPRSGHDYRIGDTVTASWSSRDVDMFNSKSGA